MTEQPAVAVTENDIDMIVRHTFLQTIMKRSCVTEAEAQSILESFGEAAVGRDLNHVLAGVSMDIAPLGFEVKRIKHFDDEQYIGFVNKEADEMSKKATGYRMKDGKPNILYAAFFKSLLDSICSNEDAEEALAYITEEDSYYIPVVMAKEGASGEIGSSQEAEEVTMSLSDRKQALDAFLADGWISKHPRKAGCYCFGPRTILELGPVLLKRKLPPNVSSSLMAAMGL